MAGVSGAKLEVGAFILPGTGITSRKNEVGAHISTVGVVARKLEVGAWLAPGGVNFSKAESGAWIKVIEGLDVQKVEVGAWLEPPDTIKRLAFVASAADHSMTQSQGARELRTMAGPKRARADMVSLGDQVAVSWTVRGDKLDPLLAFLRVYAIKGLPFIMPLVREGLLFDETVSLVPGSVSVGDRRGDAHTVRAIVQVAPAKRDLEAETLDEDLLSIYETYGDGLYEGLLALEQLANYDLPET